MHKKTNIAFFHFQIFDLQQDDSHHGENTKIQSKISVKIVSVGIKRGSITKQDKDSIGISIPCVKLPCTDSDNIGVLSPKPPPPL